MVVKKKKRISSSVFLKTAVLYSYQYLKKAANEHAEPFVVYTTCRPEVKTLYFPLAKGHMWFSTCRAQPSSYEKQTNPSVNENDQWGKKHIGQKLVCSPVLIICCD